MNVISKLSTKHSHLRLSAIVGAVIYIMHSPAASAASIRVCSSANDACSKFMDKYVSPAILLLTGVIGVLAVISYIIVGIQYSSAGDDPAAVSKAKNRAFQTTLGLIGYFFLFAFINYIVPGGLFG